MSLFPKTQHLVVIGAGYAGLPFVLRMAKHIQGSGAGKLHLSLVNPEPFQDLTCEFYRCLRDGRRASFPFTELLRKAHVDFVEARVTGIFPEEHRLELTGSREKNLSYDQLVVACGTPPRLPTIEGLDPNGDFDDRVFIFRTQSQVQGLRLALRRLQWDSSSQMERDRFVVVLGAGATGLEVAGELAALRGRNPQARVLLVDGQSEFLPGESPIARRMLIQELRRKKIEFILGSFAEKMDRSEIQLANGQVLPWDLLVLCSGNQGRQGLLSKAFPKAELDQLGIHTHQDFSIPNYRNHYAIGDAANPMTESRSPLANTRPRNKCAQFAVNSASHLADHLARSLRLNNKISPRPFSPEERAFFLSVGPDFGIARIGPLPQSSLSRALSPFVWGSQAAKLKRINELRYRKSLQWSHWFA